MKGEFLQQLKGLTEYLRAENKERDQKLKEQKVNVSAQRIAQAFDELGPDTSPENLRKLTFDLIEDAAGLDALRENTPLISSLYQSSLQYLDKKKSEKEDAAVRDYLTSNGFIPSNTPQGLDKQTLFSMSSAEGQRSITKEVDTGNETKIVRWNSQGKETFSQTIGPSKTKAENDRDERNFRQSVKLAYVNADLSLRNQLAILNQKQEYKALGEIYDQSEIFERQRAGSKALDTATEYLQGKAATYMDLILKSPDAMEELMSTTIGKKLNILVADKNKAAEVFSNLSKTDREKIYTAMLNEFSDKGAQDEFKKKYQENLVGVQGALQLREEAFQDLFATNNRMAYVNYLKDNKLSGSDIEYGYNRILQSFKDNPQAIKMVVQEYYNNNNLQGKLPSSSESDLGWEKWFKNLDDIDKANLIKRLKSDPGFWLKGKK